MAPRIPPVEQQARLKRLRRPAWLIDAAMRIPGTRFRFGLNSLLGLPPAIGDLTLGAVSLYFVYKPPASACPGTNSTGCSETSRSRPCSAPFRSSAIFSTWSSRRISGTWPFSRSI